jgi:hypothetical protein
MMRVAPIGPSNQLPGAGAFEQLAGELVRKEVQSQLGAYLIQLQKLSERVKTIEMRTGIYTPSSVHSVALGPLSSFSQKPPSVNGSGGSGQHPSELLGLLDERASDNGDSKHKKSVGKHEDKGDEDGAGPSEGHSTTKNGYALLPTEDEHTDDDDSPGAKRRRSSFDAIDIQAKIKSYAVYSFNESVWDGSVMVGMQPIGNLGSAVLLFCVLMNVIAQATFVSIVGMSFIHDPYPPTDDIRRWREQVGHDWNHMDKGSSASLMSRICGGDHTLEIASSQVGWLRDIRAYLKAFIGTELHMGSVGCTLVLFLWYLDVTREVKLSIDFMICISRLPVSANDDIVNNQNEHADDTLEIKSLQYSRIVFLIFIGAVRFIVSMILLLVGLLWLSNTKNIEAQITNVVALSSVLSMDEYIFQAFAPDTAVALLKSLEPMPKPIGRSFSGISMETVIAFFLIFSIIGVTVWTQVFPWESTMEQIETALCGGNMNFVYGVQEGTGFVMAVETPVWDSTTKAGSFERRIVRQFVEADRFEDVQEAWFSDSLLHFQQTVTQPMLEYQSEANNCIDTPGYLWSHYQKATLWHLTGTDNVLSCADLSSYCTDFAHKLVRFICPVTCGCANPISGLYLNGEMNGCPRKVCLLTKDFENAMNTLPCADPTPAQLMQMPAWTSFWHQYEKFQSSTMPDEARTFHNISATMMARGCSNLGQNPGQLDAFGDNFCVDTLSASSVRGFCPVACGCSTGHTREHGVELCPTSCVRSLPPAV